VVVPAAETSPKKSFWKSSVLQLAVGIVVSAICLYFAGRSLWNDPKARAELAVAFQTANYALLPILWGLLAAFYWVKAWRWQMLLQPLGNFAITRECAPPMMIGFAFNNVLPAHLGEFVRIFVFARQHKASNPAVFSTVALERVFDILAILAYLGIGLMSVKGVAPGVKSVAQVVGLVAAAGVLGAFAFVIWTRPVVRLAEGILSRLPFLPEGLRGKIVGLIEAGASGLAALKSPKTLLGILITSILQWGMNGLLIHLSLASFDVHVSPAVSLIVLGVVAFGVTVPSSPGYFGVIQLCFVEVLRHFPVNQPAVLAASVYYHMIQWVPVTVIGLLLFARSGVRLREVESAKATTADEADPPVEMST